MSMSLLEATDAQLGGFPELPQHEPSSVYRPENCYMLLDHATSQRLKYRDRAPAEMQVGCAL